jgi:hypothetical protein
MLEKKGHYAKEFGPALDAVLIEFEFQCPSSDTSRGSAAHAPAKNPEKM